MANDKLVTNFYSYFKGRTYEFQITSDRQSNCPKWNPEMSDNPPVSAAKALSVAKRFVNRVQTEANYKWELQDLALVDVDGWAWRAQFQLSWQLGANDGPPPVMQCWILMDGTVVEPAITSKKP